MYDKFFYKIQCYTNHSQDRSTCNVICWSNIKKSGSTTARTVPQFNWVA